MGIESLWNIQLTPVNGQDACQRLLLQNTLRLFKLGCKGLKLGVPILQLCQRHGVTCLDLSWGRTCLTSMSIIEQKYAFCPWYLWLMVREHSATVVSARWAAMDCTWPTGWTWCAWANNLHCKKKKKKKSAGGVWMVEHSPKTLASEKKSNNNYTPIYDSHSAEHASTSTSATVQKEHWCLCPAWGKRQPSFCCLSRGKTHPTVCVYFLCLSSETATGLCYHRAEHILMSDSIIGQNTY